MDNLKELSNQLDNIKTKLTDKEYKDLMELAKKIYDKKDKKFVKCLIGKFKLNIYEKDDDEEIEINIVGNHFKHLHCEDEGSHSVYITKNISFEEKIFEVKENNCDCPYGHMDVDKNWMCNKQYDRLKNKKYETQLPNDDSDFNIVVYLGDIDN